ncbi:uncharacterized protein LOC125273066 [Megalobrama amblycephala]|uniref:uncharacterized protein LOC125273066 n=1 Tax=Megalobrama amblycephala TaxID=75352 RepID=UPI002014199C|nr:uncharacterized protein LOC125273066 [Megalobrama amblycephala]
MKSVSVKEGDSVTLDTGFKEESDVITWWFKSSLIVESDENGTYTDDETFGDRLELNYETGSLTINNMTTSDSGNYHLEINHNNRTLSKMFIVTVHVFGADEDGVKRVSVKEGDSVTLNTGFKEDFNHINWLFGDSYSFIAKSDGDEISYTGDERFRDRLELNDQTGSLTINNTRITDSGIYKVEINHGNTVTFMVNVCGSFYPYPGLSPGAKAGIGVVILLLVLYIAAVLYYHHKLSKRRMQNHEENTIFVKEGNHATLNPDTEIKSDDVNMWMFEDQDSVIAQMTGPSRETFDGPDGRFSDGLKLDEKTGSLS